MFIFTPVFHHLKSISVSDDATAMLYAGHLKQGFVFVRLFKVITFFLIEQFVVLLIYSILLDFAVIAYVSHFVISFDLRIFLKKTPYSAHLRHT